MLAWSRVTVLGLLVAGTAPLWVLAPEGLSAMGVIAPYVAVPLIAAAGVWSVNRRWMAGVGAVTGVGLLVAVGDKVLELLGHPDSFFDFFPAVSLLVGAGLAAGAGARSAVGAAWPASTGRRERAVAVMAIGLLVALGAVSVVLSLTGQHTVGALDRFAAEPVRMVGFAFAPATLTVRADQTARFVVRNDDLALHTFTIDDLDVDAVVKPGREVLVEFPAGPPATYTLYCRPHTADGDGMVGALHVR